MPAKGSPRGSHLLPGWFMTARGIQSVLHAAAKMSEAHSALHLMSLEPQIRKQVALIHTTKMGFLQEDLDVPISILSDICFTHLQILPWLTEFSSFLPNQ